MPDNITELKNLIKGEIADDEATLVKYSHDASLFEIKPRAVIFPKDSEDVKNIVKFAAEKKLSVTARAAGTDMTGGPLNDSLVLDFTKYFNRIKEIGSDYAIAESGVYYRDFEKEAEKRGLFLPSYPASKEICAIGGMIANNSGGEKSLIYGKTENYIDELKVVLTDGNEYTIKKLSKIELEKKIKQQDFEGELYRKMHDLLEKNFNIAKNAKPDVSKNSSGYNIWDVWDKNYFNLIKLFVGSQGTLGIITEAKLRLEKIKPHSGMLVIFMKDLSILANLINEVLPFKPTSFESFDDNTLKLALRFFTGFLKRLGAANLLSLGFKFLPDFYTILTFGMPKLVLLVEFEENTAEEVNRKIKELRNHLVKFPIRTRVAASKAEADKYWVIRRESFNLLRHKIKNKQTAPFIDDFIVKPEFLPEFLPRLYKLLDKYGFFYTIAGHVGNGNFHIIPLMTLSDAEERNKIPDASKNVYDLVLEYKGSISAEHNDGLVRSPYLEQMFGRDVCRIFENIKNIFDPQNIFNPRKKIGATIQYALEHIKHG